ncbi:MAG TPA: heavy-metal-associated domain-containing protein [Methylophilaceae bacterium]|nr:heavy-metal-associated domain-containing protein [Methylophilaceae bacterium]
MRTGKLMVSGITCAGWARELQSALKSLNGVNDARVTAGSGEAEVVFDEKETTLDDLKIAIMQQGFTFCASYYSLTN